MDPPSLTNNKDLFFIKPCLRLTFLTFSIYIYFPSKRIKEPVSTNHPNIQYVSHCESNTIHEFIETQSSIGGVKCTFCPVPRMCTYPELTVTESVLSKVVN
ncbi:hypothetical protein RF11_08460 [Thelohanellus kitauei]|uniref:Uncharacterized protein n=1 Tax=Thelohanellus kitauei TaxID=669202 RepID=A0A0C2JU91_THEKT|nr:hypothetical protein RF11_08460 [Thelohanellus kitauei]